MRGLCPPDEIWKFAHFSENEQFVTQFSCQPVWICLNPSIPGLSFGHMDVTQTGEQNHQNGTLKKAHKLVATYFLCDSNW